MYRDSFFTNFFSYIFFQELTLDKLKTVPVEIYTLTKGNWILKCQILYMHDEIQTFCMTP